MVRIVLPDDSQQPRIGVMVPEAFMDNVKAAFHSLQPDQPWLEASRTLYLQLNHKIVCLTSSGRSHDGAWLRWPSVCDGPAPWGETLDANMTARSWHVSANWALAHQPRSSKSKHDSCFKFQAYISAS